MPEKVLEKNLHSLFKAGIFIKALVGLGEIIFGLAFYVLSPAIINSLINFFVEELREIPGDFLVNIFLRIFHDFSVTPQLVWGFIFLSHGIVKIFLLAGLFKNKFWAYPVSILIFTIFVFYQFYRLSIAPSVLLWFITIFNIIFIGLILHEYKHKKNQLI